MGYPAMQSIKNVTSGIRPEFLKRQRQKRQAARSHEVTTHLAYQTSDRLTLGFGLFHEL
jgi:hypothetical protein